MTLDEYYSQSLPPSLWQPAKTVVVPTGKPRRKRQVDVVPEEEEVSDG